MLARLLARLAGPAREGREAKADGAIEGKKGEPAAHVEADVAGFAWMKAAGVTLPREACVLRVYPPPPGPRARIPVRARLPNDRRSAPPLPPPPGPSPRASSRPRDPLPTPLQTHTATPRTPRRRRNPPRRGPRPGLEPRPGPPPDALLPGHRPPSTTPCLARMRSRFANSARLSSAPPRPTPDLLGTPELRRFVNDACLCRYLRARQWSPARRDEALTATLDGARGRGPSPYRTTTSRTRARAGSSTSPAAISAGATCSSCARGGRTRASTRGTYGSWCTRWRTRRGGTRRLRIRPGAPSSLTTRRSS